MSTVKSKRANILLAVQKDINTNNYFQHRPLMVFGASSLDEMNRVLEPETYDREEVEIADSLSQVASDYIQHRGRRTVTTFTTLNDKPPFKTNAFQNFTKEVQHDLKGILAEGIESVPLTERPDEDAVDAAITTELLGKLPKAVDRAVRLEDLGLESSNIPSPLKKYFEEGHKCYLFGFGIACAVLCRAIIEAALSSVCKLSNADLQALIEYARKEKILIEDRPDCAHSIRLAGNDAVHNYELFEKKWRNKLDENLINTRKILLDLYSSK